MAAKSVDRFLVQNSGGDVDKYIRVLLCCNTIGLSGKQSETYLEIQIKKLKKHTHAKKLWNSIPFNWAFSYSH